MAANILEEDEYGYVNTKARRISQVLIPQLPSQQITSIEDIEDESRETEVQRELRFRSISITAVKAGGARIALDTDKVYEILNADPKMNEEEKLKKLREMHQSLTWKRQVMNKLQARARKKSRLTISHFTHFQLRTAMMWHKFMYDVAGLSLLLELWRNKIKKIQGHFGSGVASYFIFVRWLLWLNVGNFIVSFLFVSVPQMIYTIEGEDNSDRTAKHVNFMPYDFLTGKGWLTNTVLYFGYYTHTFVEQIKGIYYNLPLAYVLVVCFVAVANLIIIAYYVTTSYEKNYVDSSVKLTNLFADKLFCSWDYNIETEESAHLRKHAFCVELQELLSSALKIDTIETMRVRVVRYIYILFVNILVFSGTTGLGYFIFYSLQARTFKVNVRILDEVTIGLVVNVISTFFYFVLKYVTNIEYYLSKKMMFRLTLLRVVILRSVLLGIVIYFWMVVYSPPPNKLICYETVLGQNIYRLLIIQFLLDMIFMVFFWEFLRKVIQRYLYHELPLPEFDVAFNLLSLLYYQALAWAGALCSPLLSFIMIIILMFSFYVRSTSVQYNCHPPRRFQSFNEARTLFLGLCLIVFFLSYFPIGYEIFYSAASDHCGPFKAHKTIGIFLKEAFFGKSHQAAASHFVKHITSPGFMFIIFCIICVVVYFMRARAMAHVSIVKMLREQLLVEGRDKVFLLRLYDDALQQLQQAKPQESDTEMLVVNEGYDDYWLPSPSRPLDPGYLPADVPVNHPQCFPMTSHQPGFQYLRDQAEHHF